MIIPKYVPKITLENGLPVRPMQISAGDWEKYWAKGQRIIDALGISWREIVEKEIIRMPPIKYRIGRNKWANRLMHRDYAAVLEQIYKRKRIPTHTLIARELGISVSTLKKYARDRWHLTLPHAQPHRKYLSVRLNGRFTKR